MLPLTAGETVITEISFSGLKRTREGTVLKILHPLKVGEPYTEETGDYIIQTLRETRIFNPTISVEAERTGEEVRLRVHLQDRWTLIPVPFFSVNDNGSWRGGAMVIEGNLLGLNKTLGLGYFFGAHGWTLASFFVAPKFLGWDMKLTASGSGGLSETENLDAEEKILRDFQADELGFSPGLEIPFLLDSLFLLGTGRYERFLPRPEGEVPSSLADLETLGLTAAVKWKDIYYDIYSIT